MSVLYAELEPMSYEEQQTALEQERQEVALAKTAGNDRGRKRFFTPFVCPDAVPLEYSIN